ncbi:MAG: hypothetical protein FWB85_07860 [Chitinispirillia bacterium]|nr:hypothetical protein [Chitinispirillia bacterium]MCL2242180.1 hypothetical protein [Chitinispirillia bacterium]
MLSKDQLTEIRERAEKATPGPWEWEVKKDCRDVKLLTAHSGRYYVMNFERYGMDGAAPSFQVYEKYDGALHERGSQGMRRADALAKSKPGMEHHHGYDDYIDHPDAIFIEHSRQDISALLEHIAEQDALIKKLDADRRRMAEIADGLDYAIELEAGYA